MKHTESAPVSMAERIRERYPGSLVTAEGLDEAIIGIDEGSMRVVYSVRKILELLQREGMDHQEASEFFDFNIAGSYLGDQTPIWCVDTY